MSILPVYDLDIYLLNFLDIKSILILSSISKKHRDNFSNMKLYMDIREISKKELFQSLIADTIRVACKYCSIALLVWFKNSGYEFKYTAGAINLASNNGDVAVLQWFKNSGYEFKYTSNAIDWASFHGHVAILEWFKNSGYELKN